MDIPDMIQHWIPVPLLATGFWVLLKRTFTDFESKLGSLFEDMKGALKRANEHDKRLALLEQRVEDHESKCHPRKRRRR